MADVVPEIPLQPTQPASSGAMSFNPIVDIANKALTQSGNMANSQTQNSTGTLIAPSETAQASKEAAQALPQQVQTAQQALDVPAQFEQQQGMLQGQEMQDQGNRIASRASQVQVDQNRALAMATEQSHQATINAETQLKKTADMATIDPNRHLKDLGVDGRLVTSLGMLISGAGSGLTGQPNLAMDMFNKNVERSIAAQKQTFLNNYEVMKGNLAVADTAQRQQMISAQAGAAAAMSVATGLNTAMQGLQMATKSNYAPAIAEQAKLSIQNILLNAQAQYNKIYGLSVSSQDMLQMNANGMLADAMSMKLQGKHLFQAPTSRFSLNVGGSGQPPTMAVPTVSPEQQMSIKSGPSDSMKAGAGLPAGNIISNYKGSLLEALANGQVGTKK
jgi:hypothetical protein